MRGLIVLTVAAFVMSMASGQANMTYTFEEKGCVEEYHIHMKKEGTEKCELLKELVECLLEHPEFDHYEPNDVARIEEILEHLGRESDCSIDYQQIGKELEEGKDRVDTDVELDNEDPTDRTAAYIECADTFLDIDSNHPNSKCITYRGYIQCILIVEKNLGVASELDVKELQKHVDTEFFQGTDCDLNVTTMLSAILAKDLHDDVATTTPPRASSTEELTRELLECSEMLTNEFLIGSIEHSCPKVEKFIKCYFEALKNHHILKKPEDYKGLGAELERRLQKYNLQCDLNIHGILRKLRDGEDAGPGPNPTAVPEQLEKSTVASLPSSEQDQIQQCFETFHQVTRTMDPEDICDHYKEYLVCVFQVLKRNTHRLTPKELQDLQELSDQEMSHCELQITSLYNSVLNGQGDSGSNQGDHFCIDDPVLTNVCLGLPDGDYALCPPQCESGAYIVCSNRRRIPSQCPNGYYGNRLFPLVFDPSEKSCQYSATYCPRPALDNLSNRK